MAEREWSWPGITESERRAVRFAMSHRDEYEDRGPDSCTFAAAFAESEITLALDAIVKDAEGLRADGLSARDTCFRQAVINDALALIAKHRPGGE